MIEKMRQRYLTIEELFSYSWDFFRTNLSSVLILSLLLTIPMLLGFVLMITTQGVDIIGHQLYSNLESLLTAGVFILAGLVLMHKIEENANQKPLTFSDSLNLGSKRLLPVIGTSVMLTIALVILVLLLIVPGVIFGVYWTFAIHAVILRNQSMGGALKYSKSIVNKRWWRVFGIYLLITAVATLISMAGSFLFAAFYISAASTMGLAPLAIAYWIATFVSSVAMLFAIVQLTYLFLNLDYLTYPTQAVAAGSNEETPHNSVTPDDPTKSTADILDDDAWGEAPGNNSKNTDHSSRQPSEPVSDTLEHKENKSSKRPQE